MICCLCGEGFSPADVVLRLTQHRLLLKKASGQAMYAQMSMEDGSSEKLMHLACPVEFGAPLALVGADRRPDV